MILSKSKWSDMNEIASQVVVVGSGAAGISLALELESLGWTVIILEAGEESYTQESQEMYSGDSIGTPLPYGLTGSRLRFFGGSTNCWGGGCGELDDVDFLQRDWVENSGWPISRDDLTIWYKKATRFLRLSYPSSVPLKFTPNFKAISGMHTRCLSATPILRFNQEFKGRIELSDKITLLTGANCTNISYSSKSGSVDNLTIDSFDGSSCKVKGSKFILATGGLENARILLNSYEQFQGALPRNYNTGKYFSDHPVAPSASLIGHEVTNNNGGLAVASVFDRSEAGNLNFPYYTIPYEVQKKEKILNGAVQFSLTSAQIHPSVNAAWRLKNAFQGNSSNFKFEDIGKVISSPLEVLQAGMNRTSGKARLAMRFQIEQSPNPKSKISLSENKDQFGLRKAKLDWNFTDLERRTVDVINYYVSKNVSSEGQGLLKLDQSLLSEKKKLPEDLRGGQHHSGATRMAKDSGLGVVDLNLKVFESENLYVTGSSVFPTNGWVNPTLSIIALSMRLANHLDRELR